MHSPRRIQNPKGFSTLRVGMVWIAGWLFTIGYLQLSFTKGLLAIILRPYYLGLTLAL